MPSLVSVIIPCYNVEKTVADTVRSALTQTHEDMDILLIDDGSTDGTAALLEVLTAEDSRIRLLSNPGNLGLEATRNRGLADNRGDYAALLDADDQWEPDKLERQLRLMKSTGCDFCYTGYSFMDAEGNPLRGEYLPPEEIDYAGMLRENVVGNSTVVMTRQVARDYRFRTGWGHEDYVLWMELLRDGKTARGISDPLMRYRRSPHSRSGDKKKAAANRWRIYRRFLDMGRLESARAFASYALRALRKHRR